MNAAPATAPTQPLRENAAIRCLRNERAFLHTILGEHPERLRPDLADQYRQERDELDAALHTLGAQP